jgi:hypothetical protein
LRLGYPHIFVVTLLRTILHAYLLNIENRLHHGKPITATLVIKVGSLVQNECLRTFCAQRTEGIKEGTLSALSLLTLSSTTMTVPPLYAVRWH